MSAYLKIIFVGLKLKFPNKIPNAKQQKMQSDDLIIIIINVMMNTIAIMVTMIITITIIIIMKITIIIMIIRVILIMMIIIMIIKVILIMMILIMIIMVILIIMMIIIMIISVACTSPSPTRSLGSHTSSRSTNHSWLR